jgi:hypothetical protein
MNTVTNLIKYAIVKIRNLLNLFFIAFISQKNEAIIILASKSQPQKTETAIVQAFFGKSINIDSARITQHAWIAFLLGTTVLDFTPRSRTKMRLAGMHEKWYWVNPDLEPLGAWELARAVNDTIDKKLRDDFVLASHQRFKIAANKLRQERNGVVTLFGTGPSLAFSENIAPMFKNGINVVCNTIVRDPQLWNALKPDFICAGDAIYHFSQCEHAVRFRSDLLARMSKSPNTLFVFPELFLGIVKRDLAPILNQCIAVPWGQDPKLVIDLTTSFLLPGTGNVFNLLMYPLGTTLAKNIAFIGFDGRAPTDTLFWKNSTKHTYEEHTFAEMRQKFPAFFTEMVPTDNPTKYVQALHGTSLDMEMNAAETEKGYRHLMLHPSWTKTFNDRYPGNLSYSDYRTMTERGDVSAAFSESAAAYGHLIAG